MSRSQVRASTASAVSASSSRSANRANATIYTIDPRGLVAGADLDEQLDPVEYADYVRKSQDSLRVLAEETGGIAVVNPIPVQDEIPAEEINGIIDQAIADMEAAGIHGKEATPYLLGRIVEITQGASLTANIALVNNNARLGAQVAREYAALRSKG